MPGWSPVIPAFDPVGAGRQVSAAAAARADTHDCDGGFPTEDVRELGRLGLLAAPIPAADGGRGLGEERGGRDLVDVLRLVGYGSLALGRLYEGHVNALHLVARYGDAEQRTRLFADAAEGHLFGVWNTESAETGLVLEETGPELRLRGGKTFASGAGHVTRGLVTGRQDRDGPPLMLVVPLEPGRRADLSAWRAQGMRASATGTVDLTAIVLPAAALLGGPDDYHRQPFFSGGAWRFAAVQLGGIEAVFDTWRDHLGEAGRGADPHQLARLGEGAMAVETARHWVERAAATLTDERLSADRIVAFVNLARLAVEKAGLEVLGLAQRSIGLQGFLRGHRLERLSRDLATYLRQPAPDRALVGAAATILSATGAAGEIWRP